jgi:hypothetical protein
MQRIKLKAIIVILTITAGIAMIPSQASAAWTCGARGTTGATGWGYSVSIYRARRIALANCAVRTPRGYTCYLTGCR